MRFVSILIAGGGPVGMTLALWLARNRCWSGATQILRSIPRWTSPPGDDLDLIDPNALLARFMGGPIPCAVLVANPWTPHLLIAEVYRQGRVFLAGDAVTVKTESPFKSWADVIAHAKANPGVVTYGTPAPAPMCISAWSACRSTPGSS
jgi:hypothetical protein